MEKFYELAGVSVSVSASSDILRLDDWNLIRFEVETAENPVKVHLEMVEDLPAPKGELVVVKPDYRVYDFQNTRVYYHGSVENTLDGAYMCAEHRDNEVFARLKRGNHPRGAGDRSVLNAMNVVRLVTRAGGVIFHSSYIEYDGKAILFTAPSGTGKSTQAELWRSLRGARIINGDRSAIRFEDGVLCAMGIPFAGSSTYCENRTLPLAAIVYLAQAPETTIRKVRGAEAFRRIWEGCTVNTWDRTDVDLASETVMKIASSVPIYYLACTPDESAVIALEQFLREKV